jgi:hypothetical protein
MRSQLLHETIKACSVCTSIAHLSLKEKASYSHDTHDMMLQSKKKQYNILLLNSSHVMGIELIEVDNSQMQVRVVEHLYGTGAAAVRAF